MVAVGMRVTPHPPHRSRRAGLPHRALALGNNAKTYQRVRMADTRQGNPPGNQALHPSPRQVVFVAAAPQHLHPQSTVLFPKHTDGRAVHWHAIVARVAPDHRSEMPPLLRDRLVHPSSKFPVDLFQFPLKSLAHRLSEHGELAVSRLAVLTGARDIL
jgi:hypothetical protein